MRPNRRYTGRPALLPGIAVNRAVILFVLLLACCPLQSAILLEDFFNYPDGPIVSVSAGKWTTHSGTTGQVDVASGRVVLTGSETEDVSALLAGQPYDSAGATNQLYTSFIVRFTTLPAGAGSYLAHFRDPAGSGFRARVWALTNGAAASAFRIGISSTGGSAVNVSLAQDLVLNTDYRVVTRLSLTNSVSALWINPLAESDPSVVTTESATTFTAASYAFRQHSGMGACLLDDLRMGTTFADVVPAAGTPPSISAHPANQTVVEGGTAIFIVRAEGTPPLSYQWQWNGSNIPGATGTALTLANVTTSQGGNYRVQVSNPYGALFSEVALLTVNTTTAYQPAALSLLSYNVKGNGATNWSTNAPQVQAIGRQMSYLKPDVITFQEIPFNLSHEMTNFVKAYLPGYFLANNSGTDGFVRSVIASRFPITRSQKWLDGVSLTNFGYNGNFTRDLFEAQIAVPGFAQPLHVFTTHLKSGGSADDAQRRAAEAGAISNYFVTGFLTTNSQRPYVLTGDINEDVDNPPSNSQQPVQRLANLATGLQWTTPRNPFDNNQRTWSIQAASLSSRLDYIFPGGLLFTNIASSQVFRTDLLNPTPPAIQQFDNKTASDHLPVLMVFHNPWEPPFHIASLTRSNQQVTLNWQSALGRQYNVEAGSTLGIWSVLASNLTAQGSGMTFATNTAQPLYFFRVRRLP